MRLLESALEGFASMSNITYPHPPVDTGFPGKLKRVEKLILPDGYALLSLLIGAFIFIIICCVFGG